MTYVTTRQSRYEAFIQLLDSKRVKYTTGPATRYGLFVVRTERPVPDLFEATYDLEYP